jgi:hypothetical protein
LEEASVVIERRMYDGLEHSYARLSLLFTRLVTVAERADSTMDLTIDSDLVKVAA